MNAGPGELRKLPIVRFSRWVKYLLDYNMLDRLTGVPESEMKPLLGEFWLKYRRLYPEHQLFTLADNGQVDLRRTIPVYAHVDEGRTYKSKALLLLSLHGCVGKGTRSYNRRQVRKLALKRNGMGLNYIGSTWSTQFAVGCLLRSAMNQHPSSLDTLLEHFAADATMLATTGVQSTAGDRRVWAQVLGLKGDLPALVKCGNFTRNYARGPKQATGKKPCGGICWQCLAGCEEGEHIPFEDYRSTAKWKTTMWAARPWSVEPPILGDIPMRPQCPEKFFQTDLWHNWHNGLGKFGVVNCLVIFIYSGQLIPVRSVEDKLKWLTSDFIAFCKRSNITPFLKEFTRDNLSFDSHGSCPQGLWSKALVTTQTMLYVQDFCDRFLQEQDDEILDAIVTRLASVPFWSFVY